MIKNNDTHTIKINPRRTDMKILFYDTKSYDKESFEATLKKYPGIQIDYIRSDLDPRTAALADGFDAVCAFVSSNVSEATLKILHEKGVRLVLLRCAGYNNVDLEKPTAYDICVMRVPGYSPEAVAEHAMALALACNRRLYKAYNKVRENDFSLAGLMGFNFYGKIAGIIGTGRIGAAMCRIKKMKDGVILVNTSRGALVKTEDLIEGIRLHKFAGVGLDVYEEETKNVFEDRSDEILEHSTTARLLSFPNVMITSHQGFFTKEALEAIAETTLQNALDFESGKKNPNQVQ